MSGEQSWTALAGLSVNRRIPAPILFTWSLRIGNFEYGQSPPWTAVAAATAFRLRFVRQTSQERKLKGGSGCYRSPRRFANADMKIAAM